MVTILYYLIPHSNGLITLNGILILLLYSFWLVHAVGTKNKMICNKGTKFLSRISMEIYLSHMVYFRVLEKLGLTHLLGDGVLSYICVVCIILIGLMIVIPFLQKGLS